MSNYADVAFDETQPVFVFVRDAVTGDTSFEAIDYKVVGNMGIYLTTDIGSGTPAIVRMFIPNENILAIRQSV